MSSLADQGSNEHRDNSSMTDTQLQDLLWAQTNSDLEREYLGEYVVLWKRRVVAHGTDLESLLNTAATAGRHREELVVVAYPSFVETPR